MYPVGEVSRKAERLNEVTYECLMRGIGMVRPGAHLGDGRSLHNPAGVKIEVEFHPVEGDAVARDLDDRHTGKTGGCAATRGKDDLLASGGDKPRDRFSVLTNAVQKVETRAFRVLPVTDNTADRACPRLVNPSERFLNDGRDSSVLVSRRDQGGTVLQFRVRCGGGKPVLNSFYYHYARLIEMIYAIEKIEELLKNDETMSEHVKTSSKISREKGIGCSEAPRGTLFHEYHVTKYGIITAVNLLIATGNNNLAMNAGVKQVAKKFVNAKNITEGALNRVEAVIRCFDPCLSCSTHALGIVSSRIEVRDHNKNILKVIERN